MSITINPLDDTLPPGWSELIAEIIEHIDSEEVFHGDGLPFTFNMPVNGEDRSFNLVLKKYRSFNHALNKPTGRWILSHNGKAVCTAKSKIRDWLSKYWRSSVQNELNVMDDSDSDTGADAEATLMQQTVAQMVEKTAEIVGQAAEIANKAIALPDAFARSGALLRDADKTKERRKRFIEIRCELDKETDMDDDEKLQENVTNARKRANEEVPDDPKAKRLKEARDAALESYELLVSICDDMARE